PRRAAAHAACETAARRAPRIARRRLVEIDRGGLGAGAAAVVARAPLGLATGHAGSAAARVRRRESALASGEGAGPRHADVARRAAARPHTNVHSAVCRGLVRFATAAARWHAGARSSACRRLVGFATAAARWHAGARRGLVGFASPRRGVARHLGKLLAELV